MSRSRWALSALILFHLTAVAVATVPAPGDVDALEPRSRTAGRDAVAAALTPLFDRAATIVFDVQRTLHGLLRPLRRASQLYVGAGIPQRWRMFANPPTDDRFIRLDYYVESSPGAPALWVSSEIVLPVGAAESLRYFRGKAIRNALDTYVEKESGHLGIVLEAEEVDRRLFSELVPLVTHFRARFAASQLTPPARIVRTALWYGSAPIPPPGRRADDAALAERERRLAAYEQRSPRPASRLILPRRGQVEQEADVRWRLEYVE